MKNKKAAMEMSVGTIVTIVLLMSVLVLGIFMVQKIFGGGSDAIDQINTQLENEINKLFGEEGKSLIILPSSRVITVKRNKDPAGFGFKVQNDVNERQAFTYTITAIDENKISEKCGSDMTIEKANRYLQSSEGSFSLAGGTYPEDSELILLTTPKTAPVCTIGYRIEIEGDQGFVQGFTMFVTFK